MDNTEEEFGDLREETYEKFLELRSPRKLRL